MANERTDQLREFLEVRKKEEENAPEEREPSKKDLTEKRVDTINSIPPPPEPDAGLGDEFIVKQEWIEKCEIRRLPLKKRYQLQFNETIQLKKEVWKLRKKVSRLKKKIKVYKWKAIKPKIEVSSTATQTSLIKHLFEAREFFLATEIQKWQSAANEHNKEIKRVLEKAVGIITRYIEQLYRAWQRQEKQQGNMEDL